MVQFFVTVLTQNTEPTAKISFEETFSLQKQDCDSTRISRRNFHPITEVPSPLYLVRRVFLELPSFGSPILDISL